LANGLNCFFAKLATYSALIRIVIFLLILGCFWLPFLVAFHLLLADDNLATIASLLTLYLGFIGFVKLWGDRVHAEQHPLRSYGLEFSLQSGKELLVGFLLGSVSLFLLFLLQGWLGFLQWQPLSQSFARILLEGLLVALAFGFAEELFFRGWLLDELQRDYRPNVALWLNAALFAFAHLRLLQFPGLTLLGATLVWAKWSRIQPAQGRVKTRLALPIGLHAGLVWGIYQVNVGNLVKYTGQVPAWVTGLDNQPIVGVTGLLLLSLLAIGIRSYQRQQVKIHRLELP